MAKNRTSRKKPAARKQAKRKPTRKSAARRTTAAGKKASPARKTKTSASEGPLPPKQAGKVLRKLKQLSIRPTHPTEMTGPALELGYSAPLPRKSRAKKKESKRAQKKR